MTSISVLREMAERVGGERAQVANLIPPGADVHTFQLVPKDLIPVKEADVIVFNGLGLEAAVEDVVRTTAGGDTPIIALSEKIGDGADLPEAYREGNPHLWLNVRIAMRYVETIRDAFIKADPSGAATYAANAVEYLDELEKLDREIESQIDSIPAQRRKLVTFHDAFPYLADRYGLELVGVVLKSPGREPTAKELENLLEKMQAAEVPTVYVEPQLNSRILELLASDAGLRVLTLYSDALDEVAGSYVEMMRYNARQLVEGLR
ncbi:MAG: metal ABC transporter substrate-binding protein [Dehalococcoidia bacterium]